MESKRDSKKRDAPHEVQKTSLDQSNVIQEANTSLNSDEENENDKDNNSVEAENTTSNLFEIFQKTVHEDLQANSFYYRTTRIWNELPKKVVNAKNINALKSLLDEVWKDREQLYTTPQQQRAILRGAVRLEFVSYYYLIIIIIYIYILRYIIFPARIIQTSTNWAEITGLHTQTSNTTDTTDHWPRDQLLWKLIDHFGPPSKHYPKRPKVNFRHRRLRMISTVLKRHNYIY